MSLSYIHKNSICRAVAERGRRKDELISGVASHYVLLLYEGYHSCARLGVKLGTYHKLYGLIKNRRSEVPVLILEICVSKVT